ncbi:hypothetical protein QTP88_018397 [Uroleucon formosanum]
MIKKSCDGAAAYDDVAPHIAALRRVLRKSVGSDDSNSDRAVPSQYDATKYKRFCFSSHLSDSHWTRRYDYRIAPRVRYDKRQPKKHEVRISQYRIVVVIIMDAEVMVIEVHIPSSAMRHSPSALHILLIKYN